MFRPDLVDVWIFRMTAPAEVEILLMRRAPGEVLAGLWQDVSGSLEEGERVTAGALRELLEETGFGEASVEAFYDLDLVNQFHWSPLDAIVSAAVFAVRVDATAEPILSVEHDAYRWLTVAGALDAVVWPGYREAIAIIASSLLDEAREPWFRLRPDGGRMVD